MADDRVNRTTSPLLRLREGEGEASEQLPVHLSDELRALARSYLRRERQGHTLQPTALVHEAYLRLVDSSIAGVETRRHFMGIAARAMRQILIQHARTRSAQKRGGDRLRVALDDILAEHAELGLDLLALDDVLEELAEVDARKARVVELRFFGGLSMREIGEVLGVSARTVEADWYMARAWLRRKLGP